MSGCVFCDIAAGRIATDLVHEDERVVVFPDRGAIRRGHVQIVPRGHAETFERLAPDLAAHVLILGQRIARVQKRLYGVERVAFLFSGGDVPHAHAHVVPMHEKTDITSARYIEEAGLTFRPLPAAPPEERAAIARELGTALASELASEGSAR